MTRSDNNRIYRTIQGVEYLYWRGYYWLPLKAITCDCGKKLTLYKKFRKWKGELQEVKQGYRMCPECTSSY